MKKCVLIGMCMILCGIAMISHGCSRQDDSIETMTKGKPHTIIIPNVVECKGHVEREGEGFKPLPKMLVCDDGRVFHNITNYQDVIELNPLRQ